MHFAYPLPWWALVLLVTCSALAGAVTYAVGGRRAEARDLRRWGSRALLLAGLRATALLLLLVVLFRPLVVAKERNPGGAVVPILVDESRSMRIADVDGRRRIDIATDLVMRQLLPRLAGRFQPQLFAFGDTVSIADPARLSSADQRRTDLDAALRSVQDRYRDRPIAGIVVVSDGGTTDADGVSRLSAAPVFTVGVGGATPDREVQSLTASGSTLASSVIDLDASVVSRGLGPSPFDVRLMLQNRASGGSGDGTTVDVRHVVPAGDGVPSHVTFSVPADQSAAVYTVQIPPDARESVLENNAASVLVNPPVRKRRILFVEGAPGFEHSFLRRAWGVDPAIEVDSVVRKGKNEQGQDAFFVQADPARAPALTGGYPTTKAALFAYDAIVFGSVEWDFLTREQLAMTAAFVGERGGGVLVLGARSFASPGLVGTPLDETLPLALLSGRSPVALTAAASSDATAATTGRAGDNKLRLTDDGRDHAIMRVAASFDDNERQWAALPPLAATNLLGSAKPGASVLASADVNGTPRPLIAVQRYGRGRTLEFTGEGSWRWKMLMPAADRTHELFWRQVLRWLSADAPDPVSIVPVSEAQPGASSPVNVLVADSEFRASASAIVTLRVTAPDGQVRASNASLADQSTGRYTAPVTLDRPGLYRVDAQARQGSQLLGTAERVFLAGGSDPEFSNPGLNDAVLQRVAAQTGGRYLSAGEAGSLAGLLQKSADDAVVAAQPRDVWQHPLVFGLIATLLGAEWVLRRKRGLA